jgi:broad specificity phosphatase PhoE
VLQSVYCAGARAEPRPSGTTIVIVAHAVWIRAARAVILDEPAATMFDRPIDYAHATIVRIAADGHANVARMNAVTID